MPAQMVSAENGVPHTEKRHSAAGTLPDGINREPRPPYQEATPANASLRWYQLRIEPSAPRICTAIYTPPTLHPISTTGMLLRHRDLATRAARSVDSGISNLEAGQTLRWPRSTVSLPKQGHQRHDDAQGGARSGQPGRQDSLSGQIARPQQMPKPAATKERSEHHR